MGVGDKIGRVIVPTEGSGRDEGRAENDRAQEFLPSYLLVELDMDKESLYFVTSVPGVTSFVGPGRKPQPLREEEVNRILGQIERSPG